MFVGASRVGAAAMNRVAAIVCQIESIAERVLGRDEGYSLATLREISAALHHASARIDAEITERAAQMPSIAVSRVFVSPPDRGGAAPRDTGGAA